MLAVPSVAVEKDQMRSHAVVGMLVDSKESLDGGSTSAFGDRVQLANLERHPGFLRCTGWCMLFSSGLLGTGLPNWAPFLDFTHLRS